MENTTEHLKINEIFKDEISKVKYDLTPPEFSGQGASLRFMQSSVSLIVDQLGKLSATAQGLNHVITSGDKMRASDNHLLYLMKDAAGNGGKGEMLGMLKVGHKHLYLGDHDGNTHEVEPLCVLDFFVRHDRQRNGLGKKLFDFMLEDLKSVPYHLAVDGPSPAMLHFLAKNYGMDNMIRHANNFAVAPAFIDDIRSISKTGCSTPAAVSGGTGRFTARKPISGIGPIIHGGQAPEMNLLSLSPDEDDDDDDDEDDDLEPVEDWSQLAPPSPMETEAGDDAPAPAPAPAPASAPAPAPTPGRAGEAGAQRPRSLHVDAAAAASAAPDAATPSPAGSTVSRRDSQLTDQGFFDMKFYHNKLW